MKYIRDEKTLKGILYQIKEFTPKEVTKVLHPYIEYTRQECYHNAYEQGVFDRTIELVHGSYEIEEELQKIRDEIIEKYAK